MLLLICKKNVNRIIAATTSALRTAPLLCQTSLTCLLLRLTPWPPPRPLLISRVLRFLWTCATRTMYLEQFSCFPLYTYPNEHLATSRSLVDALRSAPKGSQVLVKIKGQWLPAEVGSFISIGIHRRSASDTFKSGKCGLFSCCITTTCVLLWQVVCPHATAETWERYTTWQF